MWQRCFVFILFLVLKVNKENNKEVSRGAKIMQILYCIYLFLSLELSVEHWDAYTGSKFDAKMLIKILFSTFH